jgi:prlF antitoxin for toxin YhaV_toxin
MKPLRFSCRPFFWKDMLSARYTVSTFVTTALVKLNMNVVSSDQTPSTIYTGRKAKTGNSEALRFEQAFFRSHPEFSDRVTAQVIAPGCMLVIAEPNDEIESAEEDPIISAFLAFIAKDMPEHITDLDSSLLQQMENLVGHIEIDPHEDLGDESLL